MKVYVVTNPEAGWDCVCDVFTNKEVAEREYSLEHYIITEVYLTEGNDTDEEEQNLEEDTFDYKKEKIDYNSFWMKDKTKHAIKEFLLCDKISLQFDTNSYDYNAVEDELLKNGYVRTYTGKYGCTLEKVK